MKTFKLLLICLSLTVSLVAQNQKDSLTATIDSLYILSAHQKEIFKQEALKKIKNFQGYLTVIASKDNTVETKKIYKEIALDDFINKGKGVIMEVSYLSPITKLTSIKRSKLIDYLDNLTKMSYSKVELKTANVFMANQLIKSGLDSNGNSIYHGVAYYGLKYTVPDSLGNATFKELDVEPIDVKVPYQIDIDRIRWLIFIGDISVIEKKEK